MDNDKNKAMKNMAAFLGLPLLIILIFTALKSTTPQKTYNYSEIVENFKNHQVVEYNMNLGSGNMEIKLKDGTQVYYAAPSANLMYRDIKDYIKEYNQQNPGSPMSYNLTKADDTSWIINTLVFIILPIAMFSFMGWFFMRRLAMMGEGGRHIGFGKAKARNVANDKRKSTFADVAGADEEKQELEEIVDFLKNPEKFKKLGARIPKGVLLIGPPGTGKTLLARAVAGEAGMPFFSMAGSDFEEMYVGVGASRVRDLFEQAKKSSPCIIFIDEIDAVGRRRDVGVGGGHDERERTLNQLLVEMDGFGNNEGVIMIAATNRPDILDPALMRTGRFDRQVVVGIPDMRGREEILKVHSKDKPLSEDVNLKDIARTTAGFTGADLENLINESALLAAKRGHEAITSKDIQEATIKVVVGTEKRSKIITEEEKKLTAYHESGHAIATYFCETQDKVHEVSIIPHGMLGGYTVNLPEKDETCISKNKMLEKIVTLMGGRAAESLVLGDISTGASSDIERATGIARSMVMRYGMSSAMGPVVYGSKNDDIFIGRDVGCVKNYSENTASKIDEEIKKIIAQCYEKTEKILKENISKLHELANFLILNEKINSEKFASLMSGEEIIEK